MEPIKIKFLIKNIEQNIDYSKFDLQVDVPNKKIIIKELKFHY